MREPTHRRVPLEELEPLFAPPVDDGPLEVDIWRHCNGCWGQAGGHLISADVNEPPRAWVEWSASVVSGLGLVGVIRVSRRDPGYLSLTTLARRPRCVKPPRTHRSPGS